VWTLQRQIPVVVLFRRPCLYSRRSTDIVAPSSLVRMLLYHMVHMALRMVDEPLGSSWRTITPYSIPNHQTVLKALTRPVALTFARSRDLCLAWSAHLLGRGPHLQRLHDCSPEPRATSKITVNALYRSRNSEDHGEFRYPKDCAMLYRKLFGGRRYSLPSSWLSGSLQVAWHTQHASVI
jgi:hypothetical protein